ncbi:hypothetical protein DVK02_05530 [Halobellus sp. Atlit-31R]|nr:hypothetical protein DVK02_05530 [Halobellus sp. Atlit-31R]
MPKPDDPARQSGVEREAGAMPSETVKTAFLGVASALLFVSGLLVTEAVGEVALDVDLKPFFLPYLLIALARYGVPTLSIGLGAGIGEGLLDVFEGYELDDPIGFLGYVLGFTVFGWYLNEIADDPTAVRSLSVGAILGAFVQALFEGFAFFIFGSTAGLSQALLSVVGNTATHGVVLGAIPLVLLYPVVRERVGTRLA